LMSITCFFMVTYLKSCIWTLLLVFADRGSILYVISTSLYMVWNKPPVTGFLSSPHPFKQLVSNSPRQIIHFLPELMVILSLSFLYMLMIYLLLATVWMKSTVSNHSCFNTSVWKTLMI
jgi:hypothetical protein